MKASLRMAILLERIREDGHTAVYWAGEVDTYTFLCRTVFVTKLIYLSLSLSLSLPPSPSPVSLPIYFSFSTGHSMHMCLLVGLLLCLLGGVVVPFLVNTVKYIRTYIIEYLRTGIHYIH